MSLRFKFGPPSVAGFVAEACFVEQARQLVESTTEAQIVVDFSSIRAISSAQLNALIALHGQLRSQSRCLVFTNMPESLAEVFRITRLDRLFDIDRSVADGPKNDSAPTASDDHLSMPR